MSKAKKPYKYRLDPDKKRYLNYYGSSTYRLLKSLTPNYQQFNVTTQIDLPTQLESHFRHLFILRGSHLVTNTLQNEIPSIRTITQMKIVMTVDSLEPNNFLYDVDLYVIQAPNFYIEAADYIQENPDPEQPELPRDVFEYNYVNSRLAAFCGFNLPQQENPLGHPNEFAVHVYETPSILEKQLYGKHCAIIKFSSNGTYSTTFNYRLKKHQEPISLRNNDGLFFLLNSRKSASAFAEASFRLRVFAEVEYVNS